MKELKVRLTFTEEILGTASSDPEIHKEFIASKAPDAPSREEEVAAVGVDGVVEKSKTVFPRNERGEPVLFDYQIKGFFKDACGMLARVKSGNESSKLKAYKKVIDGLIFVSPRMAPFALNGDVGSFQRPLRAQTAQGERVALANSETLPAGTYVDITVSCLSDELIAAVKEWLKYGELRGIGQWRNSGKGRFVYAELS